MEPGLFVALGDQFMEIFVRRRARRLGSEITDDQRNAHQASEFAFESTVSASGIQAGGEAR
jgi:hypothetical protein